MTLYEINMSTQPAREMPRPRATLEATSAHIERWLYHNTHLSWTRTYQERLQELADLQVQAQAAEVAENVREG